MAASVTDRIRIGTDVLMASLLAHKRGLPLAHLGAGQRRELSSRSGDTNAVVIDRLSDVLYTPTLKSHYTLYKGLILASHLNTIEFHRHLRRGWRDRAGLPIYNAASSHCPTADGWTPCGLSSADIVTKWAEVLPRQRSTDATPTRCGWWFVPT
jgi:hypothetical protein